MEALYGLLQGFEVALLPVNLLAALIGVALGTAVGVLPGLGPLGGAALILPFTYSMSPTAAIIMIAGIYYGGMYGGRRPRLTPNPVILHKPGAFVQPIGSPGNDVQCQAILQVLLNMHVFGMPPQQAVEAPRFATYSFPSSSEPHSYEPGLLKLEGRIDTSVMSGLAELRHRVQRWPDWEWTAGAVCTVIADQASGLLEGGADPRRPTATFGC